jgi:hypothetical protein
MSETKKLDAFIRKYNEEHEEKPKGPLKNKGNIKIIRQVDMEIEQELANRSAEKQRSGKVAGLTEIKTQMNVTGKSRQSRRSR